MATFEKDIIRSYGSLEKFAKEDGCYKIYESDTHYHVARNPADEQAILISPFVRNPRLVWPQSRPASAVKKQATTQEPVDRKGLIIFGLAIVIIVAVVGSLIIFGH